MEGAMFEPLFDKVKDSLPTWTTTETPIDVAALTAERDALRKEVDKLKADANDAFEKSEKVFDHVELLHTLLRDLTTAMEPFAKVAPFIVDPKWRGWGVAMFSSQRNQVDIDNGCTTPTVGDYLKAYAALSRAREVPGRGS
jgi:hypothetical protein